MSEWSDDAIELLKEGHAAGLSMSQISKRLAARKLGTFSSSAVVGKLHRLGLCNADRVNMRAVTVRTKPVAAPRQRANAVPKVAPPEPECVHDGAGNFFDVLTIGKGQCRYPIGEPGARDFHFCGAGVKDGSAYCEHHHWKVHVRPSADQLKREAEKAAEAFNKSGASRAFR